MTEQVSDAKVKTADCETEPQTPQPRSRISVVMPVLLLFVGFAIGMTVGNRATITEFEDEGSFAQEDVRGRTALVGITWPLTNLDMRSIDAWRIVSVGAASPEVREEVWRFGCYLSKTGTMSLKRTNGAFALMTYENTVPSNEPGVGTECPSGTSFTSRVALAPAVTSAGQSWIRYLVEQHHLRRFAGMYRLDDRKE